MLRESWNMRNFAAVKPGLPRLVSTKTYLLTKLILTTFIFQPFFQP